MNFLSIIIKKFLFVQHAKKSTYPDAQYCKRVVKSISFQILSLLYYILLYNYIVIVQQSHTVAKCFSGILGWQKLKGQKRS